MARITDFDLQLLSDYLDGALTETERSTLETRLDTEPDLQQELETLQYTVDLVRGLPPIKAPRNYTLQTRPVRLWVFPTTATFSAISAAAATLLIVVGAITLLSSNLGAPTARPSVQNAGSQVALQVTERSETNGVLALSDTPTLAPPLPLLSQPAADNLSDAAFDMAESEEAQTGADETSNATAAKAAGTISAEGVTMQRQAQSQTPPPSVLMMPASPMETELPPAAGMIMENAATGTAEFYFAPQTDTFGAAPGTAPMGGAAEAMAAIPTETETGIAAAIVAPTKTSIPSATVTLPPSPKAEITANQPQQPEATETDKPLPLPTQSPNPRGSASSDWLGMGLLIGGLALLVLAAVTTLARRRR
ncbi:MAG TPA: hypothetical protein VHO69_13225 [Phototrophicaceae bacterium]|nr:hypothetical protein [Phototrophicaceae bacterium]